MNPFYFNQLRSHLSRNCRNPTVKTPPITEKTRSSLLHRATYLYSTLPHDLKTLNPKQFAKISKHYIWETFNIHEIPKRE